VTSPSPTATAVTCLVMLTGIFLLG
jgi:hypothetical protein